MSDAVIESLAVISAAYIDNARKLTDMREQKALLVSRIDELTTQIAALVPVVKESRQAFKTASGTA